jgi:Uma2 family endonuclease
MEEATMATTRQSVRSRPLGPSDQGRTFTDEEFVGADFEEPWRYELVDGRVVVRWPDSEAHDDASEPRRDHLGAYKLAHRDRVDKVVSEARLRISPGKYRIADIAVYLTGPRSPRRRPERVPELVIEVLSPGSESYARDAVEKRAEYHGVGVLEYVLVDYVARSVLVLTRARGGYEERVLGPSDCYETPLLPGLVLELNELLPEVDLHE